MGYTPFARWRNFTLENLKTILDLYPDMLGRVERAAVIDDIEKTFPGYRKTAYQFACQLGIESRNDYFTKQNYLYFLTDEGLEKYLDFWFKMYVCPNPYVNSSDAPICPFAEIAEKVLAAPEYKISCTEFCDEAFGKGKSIDIFKNALMSWGKPLRVHGDEISIAPEEVDTLKALAEKVKATLPMTNNKDVDEFFERFSCKRFMDFYGLTTVETCGNGIVPGDGAENDPPLSSCAESFDYAVTAGTGENRIFYGIPGCGKSYYIEHNILGKSEDGYTGAYRKENIVRTTFYQDYSNTDFVGQILPKVVRGGEDEKDTVEYSFNPGPFTLALIQAISNPDEKVALVIEEINRGNAPAIFGDIFQLLDRDEYGVSEYGIVNVSLTDHLNGREFTVGGEKKRYRFTEIKIPGNMDIFATMNTSDQNVYTLDTAFVRRWEREKIKNSYDHCKFASAAVPGMPDYTWKEFVNGINGWITKHLEELQINEDKQIGVFFVKESLLTGGDAERFAFKVLDYLWNDVAKLDREIIFNPYDTLEDLIGAYKAKGVGVFKPGVFEVKSATQPQGKADDEQ